MTSTESRWAYCPICGIAIESEDDTFWCRPCNLEFFDDTKHERIDAEGGTGVSPADT